MRLENHQKTAEQIFTADEPAEDTYNLYRYLFELGRAMGEDGEAFGIRPVMPRQHVNEIVLAYRDKHGPMNPLDVLNAMRRLDSEIPDHPEYPKPGRG